MRQTPAPARKPAVPPSASFFKDPLRLQTIVVPLDLSPESLRALEFAWPLANRFGARVHVVHVYEGAHQFSSVTTSPVLWSEAEAKRHLADEVELAFGTSPRREDCHLRSGKPVAFSAGPAHHRPARRATRWRHHPAACRLARDRGSLASDQRQFAEPRLSTCHALDAAGLAFAVRQKMRGRWQTTVGGGAGIRKDSANPEQQETMPA